MSAAGQGRLLFSLMKWISDMVYFFFLISLFVLGGCSVLDQAKKVGIEVLTTLSKSAPGDPGDKVEEEKGDRGDNPSSMSVDRP